MSEEILPATLTAKERKEFAECNRIITDGLPSVWSVGAALIRVRDARLYREDFASFQEYSESKWQLSLSHAKRLMDAAEVKGELEDRAPTLAKLVVNEAQARELGKYPEEEQTKVLRGIKKSGEPITAEAIRAFGETAKSGNGKKDTAANIDPNVAPSGAISPKEEIQLDETGFKLTPTAAESWAKREVVQSLLTAVSRAKNSFEAIQDDPLFFRHQEITQAFQTVYHLLSECKPYAVCPECEGYPEKQSGGSCGYCRRTGVIAKAKYTELCNSKVASIREKAKRGRAQA